ncbi:hypothetical protein GCM10011571_17150 [Marinithermofilum abyssi]|uniref:SIS domain-containing protein n=1 Tax=Marinithermofilum abyssi TaxID=1571185 RepID=A0A8J2VHG1_9BACL|nr:SIS domain-containing protein [Marinithermofilum abyssi]GGE16090.1 hypothetical protein GCM10011571_17150 [Marinithermofilum abyssi]
MHPYVSGVIQKIERAVETQMDKLEIAAQRLVKGVEQGGVLHVLGCGHSHMIAEEIFFRAGGSFFVNPILDPGLMLHNGVIKSTRLERLTGYVEAILEDVDFRENDLFFIVSNSGRNVVPIDAALYAKERKVYTLSISSFAHSKSVSSRHPSGKRLFEITDLALDNCGEIGDAQLEIPGLNERYGATSSVVGIVLVQTLMSMAIENMVEKGIKPPLIRSANLDGTDDQNRRNMQKYQKRIPLLR